MEQKRAGQFRTDRDVDVTGAQSGKVEDARADLFEVGELGLDVAVERRTPEGNRSKIGAPSSSSSDSTRRFSADGEMAKYSAAPRMEPALTIRSMY